MRTYRMRTLRATPVSLTLAIALPAVAQAPASESPAPEAPASGAASMSGSASVQAASPEVGSPQAAAPQAAPAGEGDFDPTLDSGLDSVAAERRTGFTAGLRLGVGVPLGNAGRDPLAGLDRNLNDLTSWRAPVWVDVGYSLSGATTVGVYGQVGTGGTGDACTFDCDWSDIRIGAEVEWRLAPGAAVDPWLGLGLGYEWLTYRVLVSVDVPDGMGGTETLSGRATERFGGPELLLQAGVDFQVEDALRIGPYASATLAQYLTDSFTCEGSNECPADGSIDGPAFHSWIGVGLRGAYTP
jgi:hypothetical protein